MQSEVLHAINDQSLRAYVVWVPILPDDRHAAAAENTAIVSDARATHFWDDQRLLPPLFAGVLGLPEDSPAWDVYLAYRVGARWAAAAPRPSFWQHQLGDTINAPVLDGAAFVAGVLELLTQGRLV